LNQELFGDRGKLLNSQIYHSADKIIHDLQITEDELAPLWKNVCTTLTNRGIEFDKDYSISKLKLHILSVE